MRLEINKEKSRTMLQNYKKANRPRYKIFSAFVRTLPKDGGNR